MSSSILNDHSTVCRCCLKVLDTTGFTYIDDENGYVDNVGNVREMLQFCVPELDLYVSTQPVICYNCLPILVQIYNFKIKCLNGENLIKSYITRNNLFDYNQVNLNCVLMDDLKTKSQKIQIESRIKDMMLKEIPENNDSNNEQQVVPNDVTQSKSSANSNYDVNMETEDDYDDDDDDEDEEDNNDKEMKVEFDETEEIDLNYCENIDSAETENREIIELEKDTNKNNDDVTIINDPTQIVAVRKDLFDYKKEQPNIIEEPKEPARVILNQGMVAQNGRIIIKIDKTKLQSLGIKTLATQLSESEPKLAPIQVTVPSSSSEQSPPVPVACTPKIIQVQTVKPAEDIPENKPKYNCNKCGFETDDVIKIYDHNRSTHNFDYTCQHCPFSTSKVELLGKHMTMVHPQNMVQRSLHFKVTENYACSMCPFSVKSLDLLRSHHLSAHGNADDKVPIVLNSAFTEDCIRTEPRILKRLEYTCDVCPYTTKDKSNLRKHLFTHGTKPLKCDFCTYKCVSPYQLRRHQKQKHGKQGEQRPRNQPYMLPDFKKQNSDEMDNFKITLESIKRELEKEIATS
ncbi:unnamed protein product [Ceutorhynchus assimilis]|uniref:C2H2-type domain-containing protein n=1 Tax=Ceutorhynchus assimilis TaxID=467358 RepID=A0A9N9QLG8_9CUCU|nr:unnamed protein product [Ceutorhynchus assimilis]